jgi:ribosomal protein S18 acetylase RimI-like enzyme
VRERGPAVAAEGSVRSGTAVASSGPPPTDRGKVATGDVRRGSGAASVGLRPATDQDLPLLFEVYASTRADELDLTDWDEATKVAFLRQQFEAQHAYYRVNYTGASFDVVLVDGESAGRLYVARWPEEIRIVDIALLPRFRGSGMGTRLLEGLMAEGRRSGRPVSIHVERFNPALRLYQRLGFAQVEDRGVYLLMEWAPEAA